MNLQKQRLYDPHMYSIYERAHTEFMLSGGLTKLFLSLSFGIHYSPGLLSESLYCLRGSSHLWEHVAGRL